MTSVTCDSQVLGTLGSSVRCLLRVCAQGHFDGAMVQVTSRHQQRRKRRKGGDERAILAQQRLPEPGQAPP